MDLASSTWQAENRTRYRGVVAYSTVVPDLPRLLGRINII